jgi:phage repressor protein C with HTH and peptisase S24 domain
MNFSERIAVIRTYFKSTNAGIEKILGLSNGYLSNLEKNGTDNPGKLLVALNEKGFSADWFLTGEGEIELSAGVRKEGRGASVGPGKAGVGSSLPKPIPYYSPGDLPEGSFVVPLLDQQLSAGAGAALPEDDQPKALIAVPGYLRQYGENIAALAVDGDSMDPTLHRGDMVVCDSMGWSGEGIYAVRIGGAGFVKRLTKAPGKLVIISDNPKYPAREEPEGSEDFEIIGRVHCAIKRVE